MTIHPTRRRASTVLVALIVPVVALVAVLLTRPHWSASSGPARAARAGTATIEAFAFHPPSLQTRPGAVIRVTNRDRTTHTLSSLTGRFDSGNLNGGGHATIRAPAQAGRYMYYCRIHNYMTGTLIVTR